MAELHPAAQIVQDLLDATMAPDPVKAATYLAPDLSITFSGGFKFSHPREIAEFNGERYAWVKKSYGTYDVAESDDGTVVYSMGTLYGAWPDGTPFEGIRYIDRFLLRDGKVVVWDVWNDAAQRILERAEV